MRHIHLSTFVLALFAVGALAPTGASAFNVGAVHAPPMAMRAPPPPVFRPPPPTPVVAPTVHAPTGAMPTAVNHPNTVPPKTPPTVKPDGHMPTANGGNKNGGGDKNGGQPKTGCSATITGGGCGGGGGNGYGNGGGGGGYKPPPPQPGQPNMHFKLTNEQQQWMQQKQQEWQQQQQQMCGGSCDLSNRVELNVQGAQQSLFSEWAPAVVGFGVGYMVGKESTTAPACGPYDYYRPGCGAPVVLRSRA
jgi:hypothetical protein